LSRRPGPGKFEFSCDPPTYEGGGLCQLSSTVAQRSGMDQATMIRRYFRERSAAVCLQPFVVVERGLVQAPAAASFGASLVTGYACVVTNPLVLVSSSLDVNVGGALNRGREISDSRM
jgi:hypothetical protein